jgi:Mrp family chromosome partitioning ATPase
MARTPLLFENAIARQDVRRLVTRMQAQAQESAQSLQALSPLLVTSAIPGEGKSTLAAALASLFARELELRTLIVDLNWQNPSLHDIFGIKCNYDLPELSAQGAASFATKLGPGFPAVLTAPRAVVASDNNAGWTEIHRRGAEGGVLPADEPAMPDDVTMMGRKTLLKHLKELASGYGFVVYDGPSVHGDAPGPLDALQLATQASSSLLVVMMRVTRRELVKRVVMALAETRSSFAGVVMNNFHNRLA